MSQNALALKETEDAIPLEIVDYFRHMETPATNPIGWLLEVPGYILYDENRNVRQEIVDWSLENLKQGYRLDDPYAITRNNKIGAFVHFMTERDYILFKMRWL